MRITAFSLRPVTGDGEDLSGAACHYQAPLKHKNRRQTFKNRGDSPAPYHPYLSLDHRKAVVPASRGYAPGS
jgi:hypothetical protein